MCMGAHPMTAASEIRDNGTAGASSTPSPKPGASDVYAQDPKITWPDPLDDAPWPSPYRAFSDECTEPEPRLPRRTVVRVARLVTRWFLEDDQTFARQFYALASLFQAGSRADLVNDYRAVLRGRLRMS